MLSFSPSERVLILGASSDTGSALAHKLHSAGVQVGLISRRSDRLERLRSDTGFAAAYIDSVTSEEINRAVSCLAEELGPITGAVNLLGTLLLKPVHLTSDIEWRETISVNLDSSFWFLKSVIANSDRAQLSLVLVSSSAATTGIPNHEAIAAAKAGVEGLARSAAATYASKGYRFNVVAPGLVKTQLSAGVTSSEMSLRASEAMHPLKRLGSPEDVAGAIHWLLSAEADWVTGQVIGVDGGLATLRTRVKV
jgi:3-oxoacyl-[acyl-carrier protein] reductase